MASIAKRSRRGDKLVDLKVNRDLLDPKFESYKLSLDSFPICSQNLPVCKIILIIFILNFKQIDGFLAPTIRIAGENQWSLQHLRIFRSFNHIHLDLHSDHVFVIGGKRIYCFPYNEVKLNKIL